MSPAPSSSIAPEVGGARLVGRAAAVVAVALIGIGTVAAVWGTPHERPGVPMAWQRVGMCHRFLDPNEIIVPWDSRLPVPCGAAHQSETVGVLPLPPGLAGRRTMPSNEALSLAAPGLCREADVAGYLGDDRNERWFLELQVRYPTPAEWANGERRYRCDLVLAGRDRRGRPTRRGSLRGVMRRPESAALRRCAAGGALVPCSDLHDVELITVHIPRKEADRAPFCANVARGFLGEDLSRRGLVSQVTVVDGTPACTVGRADGKRARGTVSAQVRRR